MNDNALEVRGSDYIANLNDVYSIADTMIKSGLFKDVRQMQQAAVKIIAGREMGVGPFASMKNIYIIEGQTTISSNLIAAKVKSNPKYDYRIKELNDQGCVIAFYEKINGEADHLGDSRFDHQDAIKAGLANKTNWQRYPRNMYLSRAISNGVKFYCPDVFYGMTVYTPEEIDDDWAVNPADVEVVTEIIHDEIETTVIEEAEGMGATVTKIEPKPSVEVPDKMTLEFAENVTGSEGERYGDLPTDQLAHRYNALNNKVKKGLNPGEEKDEVVMKMDAISMLLKNRNQANG